MGLAREEGSWLPAPLLLCPRPHAENPAPPPRPGATLLACSQHAQAPLSVGYMSFQAFVSPICTGLSCPDHWPHYLPSLATPQGATWNRDSSKRTGLP